MPFIIRKGVQLLTVHHTDTTSMEGVHVCSVEVCEAGHCSGLLYSERGGCCDWRMYGELKDERRIETRYCTCNEIEKAGLEEASF